MEDIKPPAPRTFDDVARAEDVAAIPSSKPVITGNKTIQADPMMSQTQAAQTRSSNISVVPPQGASGNSSDELSNIVDESTVSSPAAEPSHKLSHEQPFFGQMKPVKSRGKKILIVTLTLLIMGAIGYGAWYFANQKSDTTQSDKPASITTEETKTDAVMVPANFIKYENKELGVSFSYPKEWGDVTLGPAKTKPQYSSTDYKQLTFTSQNLVDIDIVQGPYSSPLDGCGLPPLESEQNTLDVLRASNVGWDKEGIVFYGRTQGEDEGKKYTYSYEEDQNPGYTVLVKKSKTIAFQDNVGKYEPETAEKNGCFNVTQKEADEANAYDKYIHFASNFQTDKIKGINAQYDARITKEQSIIDNILITLNSFSKL
jgi:hypothetical protein